MAPEDFMSSFNTIAESGFAPRIGRSVTIDHAAELLGVSRRTIYNRIRDGRLQTVRTLGGSQRVTVESVVQLGGRTPGSVEKAKTDRGLAITVMTVLCLAVALPAWAQRARLSEDLADHLAAGSQTINVIVDDAAT